jgi:hypothetical protein
MAIKIVLLAVFDVLRPTQSFPCLKASVSYHQTARVPARATGGKPKDPPRLATPPAPLTHATTRNPAVCGALSECFATTLISR